MKRQKSKIVEIKEVNLIEMINQTGTGNYDITPRMLFILPYVVEEVDKQIRDGSGNGLINPLYRLCDTIDLDKLQMSGEQEFIADNSDIYRIADCYPMAHTKREGEKKILVQLSWEDVKPVFKFLYGFVKDYPQNIQKPKEVGGKK